MQSDKSNTPLQPIPKNEMKVREDKLRDAVTEWMILRCNSLKTQGPQKEYSLFSGLVGYFSMGTETISSYHLAKLV